MTDKVFFISGIDTDAGKSYATAYLAKKWNKEGVKTITQKFIQTGNVGHSEDIDLHRKIMGIDFTEEDRQGLTMPEIFSYPASPLLASKIDKREINFEKIDSSTAKLANIYDKVLVEGAGGLMVPLTENMLTIDYIVNKNHPLIFVTSGKLGSVNHTLLSLEAIKNRGIRLTHIMYNLFPEVQDKTIQEDTLNYITNYIKENFPKAEIIIVPIM